MSSNKDFKKFILGLKNKSRLYSITKSIKLDKWLFLGVFIISSMGLFAVYESSAAIALRDFADQYFFIKEQLKWFFTGLAIMILLSSVNYRRLYLTALPMLFISVLLLVAVFVPQIGIEAYGARRWLNFGFFNFQPAELTKLTLVIYLSAWFSYSEIRSQFHFIVLIGFITGLIILEPDLGTAMVILSTSLIMYYFTGVKHIKFITMILLFISVITLIAILAPYRVQRIYSFFNPESDPLGSSYQIRQILLALGQGGLFGVGIGKSRQKYEYIPEANTDSIFAIIGEEIGFIGGLMVISLFLLIVWRGFKIALRANDSFGRYLACGMSTWIAIQAILNLSSVVMLTPITGVPLPFISYGGSSLIILFCSVGILLSISRFK